MGLTGTAETLIPLGTGLFEMVELGMLASAFLFGSFVLYFSKFSSVP